MMGMILYISFVVWLNLTVGSMKRTSASHEYDSFAANHQRLPYIEKGGIESGLEEVPFSFALGSFAFHTLSF